MKKVTFLYRDASNYKCEVTKEMTDEEAAKLEIGEEVTFESVGVIDEDIELITKYGRSEDDHNLLEVLEIENI